uniref:MARVEL domain-containing protein n=1 Tax=Tetradesmus obliquus TaxID=3088 RepID=A0A383VUI7_TETOB|eukprot:jgi/Sobl393_1/14760/SZX68533.1
MRAATACLVAVLSLLQIGTAVAVIAITAINLGNVQSLQDVWKLNQKFCLASADPKNMSVCTYIYAVGAVSIVLTILIGLLQLITCNMCGCGKVMDAVFTALACGWWLVAGFITAAHTRAANSARPAIPGSEWRNAVVLLCWATSGLFGALFVVHMLRIGFSCCRKFSKKGQQNDVEKAGLRNNSRAPSAAVELGKEVAARPYMLGRFGGSKQGAGSAGSYLSGPNI